MLPKYTCEVPTQHKKIRKGKLFFSLLGAILCIYASAYLSLFLAMGYATFMVASILFIAGTSMLMFFDLLSSNNNNVQRKQNLFFLSCFLLILEPLLNVYYQTHVACWLNLSIYSGYFIYLCVRLLRMKNVPEAN